SPKSSIVKSPQNNNQTGLTFPLPMKRIPPFRLIELLHRLITIDIESSRQYFQLVLDTMQEDT
ncbi:hypothetical protein, partial [Hungatella effluvii]|uniref:hypothetical protein n=1 Tax=Hungatella effluvii TaxID=1096246 RepID=UPI002A7ECD5B